MDHPDDDSAFRASVVGAGEVAALFDASPWLTKFELYHRKKGTIETPEFNARNPDGSPVNARIHWGVKLEPLIVEEACERWGYKLIDHPHHVTNGKGLGGHPDQPVWCPERQAPVVLEIKTVDWLERKKWGDEPPSQYLLQPNTYAGLLGYEHFDVIALVLGGNSDLQRFQYQFRPKLYAEVEKRVERFWQDVRAGREPPVDYDRDGKTLIDVLGPPTEDVADLREDLHAEQLAMEYLAAKDRHGMAAAEMERIKTQLVEIIGTASTAI